MKANDDLRADDYDSFLKLLVSISVHRLEEMFDQETQLFCYRVRKRGDVIANEGHSLRYTIISFLGLHRLEIQGRRIPFDIPAWLKYMLNNLNKIDNIGDMGLLLWLCAMADQEILRELLSSINITGLLNRFSDAREGKTTELAWFLTGLTYASTARIPDRHNIEDATLTAFDLLKNNYGGHGLFGHQKKNSLAGRLRGEIGSFADQVYPIYGFSKFARTFNNREALNIARECGQTICSQQGALGQWWWHYNRATGDVIGKYPVYSVHQHSMAPMALFALAEVSGLDLDYPIYKGLEWIRGNNELGINLIDDDKKVIWRSFYRHKYKMRFDEFSSWVRSPNIKKAYDDLKILYECRPYCLGWLLYAFADKINSRQQIR